MVNARDKGQRREREAAELLRTLGFTEAKRGQQFKGGEDSPDVTGIPGIHLEVKGVENLSLPAAIKQARRDCGSNVPSVMHKQKNQEWIFSIGAKDITEFAKRYLEALGCLSQ